MKSAFLLLPVGAYAWGNLGHMTVAYIAQNYLSDDTVSWAQNILDDTSSDYLASVATWADSFRYTSAGRFSAPYHFIDANGPRSLAPLSPAHADAPSQTRPRKAAASTSTATAARAAASSPPSRTTPSACRTAA